jgi:hypothetical protein
VAENIYVADNMPAGRLLSCRQLAVSFDAELAKVLEQDFVSARQVRGRCLRN